LPRDTISVPIGDVVYVVGEVHKTGGFVLKEHEHIYRADGPGAGGRRIAYGRAFQRPDSEKENGAAQVTQLPVDLKKIMAGNRTTL